MKTIPIPPRPAMTQAGSPDVRLRVIEQQIDALRRNVESFSKRNLDARNFRNECLELRHCSEELYGDTDDITNLRFGDSESAGTELGPFAAADHKHALDPVLILQRSDPTQLTANTNNWAIGSDNTLYYVDADAARNVTGIAGGTNGRFLTLVNDGSFTITLQHESASSTAANRFHFSAVTDIPLMAKSTITLTYDSTLARWRDTALGGGSISVGAPVIGGTVGSVLFIGTGSVVSQNNASFFWDNTNTQLLLNSAATPNYNQLAIKANSLGGVGMFCYAADNCYVLFDNIWSGGAFVAADTSIARIVKLSDTLNITVASGQTVGNSVSGAAALTTWDIINSKVGVSQSTPRVKFDVLSTSTQIRGTHTDNSVYTDYTTNSSGDTLITNTGTTVNYTVSNTSTNPMWEAIQSSTGDAAMRFAIGSTQSYIIGVDNSDSDKFKISGAASGGAALGTTDLITILSNGRTGIGISPTEVLDINHASRAVFRVALASAAVGYISHANVLFGGSSSGDFGILAAGQLEFGTNSASLCMRMNTGQGIQIEHASNGQYMLLQAVSELTTIAAAATTDTAITIPVDSVVFAVSVRVTVAIPTAATFTVTGTTSGTQFDVAGGVSTAANTTDVGTRNCPFKNGASQFVRITPNAVPAANTGRVRVTIHYYSVNPATS